MEGASESYGLLHDEARTGGPAGRAPCAGFRWAASPGAAGAASSDHHDEHVARGNAHRDLVAGSEPGRQRRLAGGAVVRGACGSWRVRAAGGGWLRAPLVTGWRAGQWSAGCSRASTARGPRRSLIPGQGIPETCPGYLCQPGSQPHRNIHAALGGPRREGRRGDGEDRPALVMPGNPLLATTATRRRRAGRYRSPCGAARRAATSAGRSCAATAPTAILA
jgi:hypothetical protein